MRVTELTNVDADAEVATVMNLLRDKAPDLVKKGHYSLLFVEEGTRKYNILKNRDVLSKLRITSGTTLFYVVWFCFPIKLMNDAGREPNQHRPRLLGASVVRAASALPQQQGLRQGPPRRQVRAEREGAHQAVHAVHAHLQHHPAARQGALAGRPRMGEQLIQSIDCSLLWIKS